MLWPDTASICKRILMLGCIVRFSIENCSSRWYSRIRSVIIRRLAKVSRPRLLGHEILKRVSRAQVPVEVALNPRTDRAVLGSYEGRYLVPLGIDVLELGLVDTAETFELLPIDRREKPLWDEVTELLVTPA